MGQSELVLLHVHYSIILLFRYDFHGGPKQTMIPLPLDHVATYA